MSTVTKPAEWLRTLLAVGVLAGFSGNAPAMRCGTELVDTGDTQREVAAKCGMPTFVEQNRWIYDPGSHKFIKIVHFGGGRVQFIGSGQYGNSGGSSPATEPINP